MGRGLARPLKFGEDGPRIGPAHQRFRGWAAARSGPLKYQTMGRRPAQLIISSYCHGPAQPGPSVFQKSQPGPASHNFQIGPAQANGPRQALVILSLFRYLAEIDSDSFPTCLDSFVLPSHLLSSPFFFSLRLLLIAVTQIRGQIARSSPPSPLRFVPCFLSREDFSSFLVDLGRTCIHTASMHYIQVLCGQCFQFLSPT